MSDEFYCGYDGSPDGGEGGWYCYRTPDGKTPIRVGCKHRNPTDAARHADELKAQADEAKQ